MADSRRPQRRKDLRGFHEDRAGAHGFDSANQIACRIARINRRRHGTIPQYPQVGKIELEPRFGIERHHVAFFFDAQQRSRPAEIFRARPPGIRSSAISEVSARFAVCRLTQRR